MPGVEPGWRLDDVDVVVGERGDGVDGVDVGRHDEGLRVDSGHDDLTRVEAQLEG